MRKTRPGRRATLNRDNPRQRDRTYCQPIAPDTYHVAGPRCGHGIGWEERVAPEDSAVGGPDGADIQAVVRAADIIRLLTDGNKSISVVEASKALGLQRTTMHRYMNTLSHVGFLQRDAQPGRYALGPLVVSLYATVLRDRQILTIAPPQMQVIADEAATTTVLCLWGGTGVLVTHIAYPAASALSVRVQMGLLIPAQGIQTQMFMAFIEDDDLVRELMSVVPTADRKRVETIIAQARTDHFIQADDRVGIRVIVAPVFDSRGICATLAMLSTPQRLAGRSLSRASTAVRETAAQISSQLQLGSP